MPATTTLSTTTLSAPVGSSDNQIKLASTSGIFTGYRLYLDGELVRVVSLGIDPWVNVTRGVDGTRGAAHPSGVTVYIGEAHQFYTKDPVGRPAEAIPVSPYINVVNGSVWFAQGDVLPIGQGTRWWQKETVTRSVGALGVRTTTLDPESST
jgi:hypothetical protein